MSAVAVQVGDETTLDDLFGHARTYSDAVGFSIRGDDGSLPVRYAEFGDQATQI